MLPAVRENDTGSGLRFQLLLWYRLRPSAFWIIVGNEFGIETEWRVKGRELICPAAASDIVIFPAAHQRGHDNICLHDRLILNKKDSEGKPSNPPEYKRLLCPRNGSLTSGDMIPKNVSCPRCRDHETDSEQVLFWCVFGKSWGRPGGSPKKSGPTSFSVLLQ
jgi:hypothetical protein